ncbi:MAG: hypothetical protein ACI9BH_001987 [Paracoccaceae bacterium]|jgi:hypothetical protein
MLKEHALLPADFEKTGFHVQSNGTLAKRFQVLGERSSGTNFVKRLLGRNSALKPTEILGWKHGFPQMMAIPANLAVICVVRNAESWALSMFAKPWHTSKQMQTLEFAEFIRTPWDTIIDRPRYFDEARKIGYIGQPLQQDRHPMTGETFANLFALRQAKMNGMFSHLRRDCTCIVIRMEDAQAAPEASVDQLLNALGQPARDQPFRQVTKRLGARFNSSVDSRPETPAQMSADDLTFLKASLDLKTESQLGYSY